MRGATFFYKGLLIQKSSRPEGPISHNNGRSPSYNTNQIQRPERLILLVVTSLHKIATPLKMYTIIDQSTWVRRDLFTLFSQYDNPTWDLISEVRLTSFYDTVKSRNTSFFLSFLYVASKVCNSIPELRCRIDEDGQVRQYDIVHPGSTILYDNGTYGFGYFTFTEEYPAFINSAVRELESQKSRKDVDPKDDDLSRIYLSPIPWVSFSSFRHPFKSRNNCSVPMIVFGKHFERGGERYITVGITLHHGLADGYHAGLFFTQLQTLLNSPDYLR